MTTGSHHGDPALSQVELDVCLEFLDWIYKTSNNESSASWLPSEAQTQAWIQERFDGSLFTTLWNLIKWIHIARDARSSMTLGMPNWIPGHVDLLKSRLFWRLRSGKDPLPYPPPTAYSCPWYELIDEADRPHWAYECHVHKPGEPGFWGKIEHPVANIAQCRYEVLEWADEENSIPSVVAFGRYVFNVFKGPYETVRYDPQTKTAGKTMIEGWWIQHTSVR